MLFFSRLKNFIICILVTAVAVFTSTVTAYADNEISNLSIEFAVEKADFICKTEWWQQQNIYDEKEYFVSLPHRIKDKPVNIYFESSGKVYLDGKIIENGQSIECIEEGTHQLVCGNDEYSLNVLYLSDIPTIYINTQSGTLENVYADKEYKEVGYITIVDGEEIEFAGELEYIKGRGNNTWWLPKRPFNIKTIEKADLFGMGESRKWSLLANYNDDTNIKNILAFKLAEAVGLTYTPQAQVVDLYIDGDYIGNYTFTERIEIDDERVDIVDLEKMTEEVNPDINIEKSERGGDIDLKDGKLYGSYKWVEIPNNPRDITGGYLLEADIIQRYGEEISGFVSDDGQAVVIKSPEYASKEQVEYIRDYYQKMESAIISDTGYNSEGKHYSTYIDVESMAKMYIFQEYIKNFDAGITSTYYYKNASGKLIAGPVWDFDKAFGHNEMRFNREYSDPKGYGAADLPKYDSSGYTIFPWLLRHPDFKALAVKQWENNFNPHINSLLENIDDLVMQAKDSMVADKYRWAETSVLNYEDVGNKYVESIDNLKNFITDRKEFMNYAFSKERNYIYYNANGCNDIMIELGAYQDGESIYIRGPEFANGDKTFYGWNTNPYGYGDEYIPGQTYIINDDLVLYAQWEPGSITNRIKAFIFEIFH